MKMTIVNRLYFGLGFVAFILIGFMIFSKIEDNKQNTILKEADQLREVQGQIAPRIVDHLNWEISLAVGTLMFGKEFTGQLDHTQCKFGKWYYDYKPPKEVEDTFKKIEDPHQRVHASAVKVLAALKEGKRDRAIQIYQTETVPALHETQEGLMKLREEFKEIVGQKIGTVRKSQDSMNNMTIVIYIGMMVALIGGAIWFLVKPIKNKLATMSDWLAPVSQGDLTQDAPTLGDDEIGEMARNVNDVIDNIKRIANQINTTTNSLATSSEELSATSDNMSTGATELSTQTEQVVTAMTEVSQTIMDMAKNASQAADGSKNASETAAKGKQIVDTTTTDMGKIAQTVQEAAATIEELGRSSAQIGEIVAVINGIADQTNLLALNAAIEAARAGEQGRGFAVVADEVRKLAERTSQATKDIGQRISAIQAAAGESVNAMKKGSEEVEKGVARAKEASVALDSIVTASSSAMDMVQRIAAATEQQSAAAEEVSQNMEHISDITKRSSASTEQIKGSSAELARLAVELKEMTAWFKVNGSHPIGQKSHGIALQEGTRNISVPAIA